ncbi:MAG: type II secretion system protein N, partial [Bacteroidetes bacterium]|nr:type II secretion system protein N [Bacteroidota bacterium]
GTLDWTDVSLSMDDKTVHQASGNIKWKDASLSINNNLLTLGIINIEVSDEEGDLLLTITDQNSKLDVRGTLRLGVDKRYHLLLSLTDELPSNIKNAVLMVARPDGKGRLQMNTKGRL